MELVRVDCPAKPKSHDRFFGFENEDNHIEGVLYRQNSRGEIVEIACYGSCDDPAESYSVYVSSIPHLIQALLAAQEYIRAVENKDAF